MIDNKIKEMLEQQMQILSDRSRDCAEDNDLIGLTHAMVEVISLLCSVD